MCATGCRCRTQPVLNTETAGAHRIIAGRIMKELEQLQGQPPFVPVICFASVKSTENLNKYRRERWKIRMSDPASRADFNRQKREYYHQNKAVIIARQRKYYQENREKVLSQIRQHRRANPEKLKARNRDYRTRNREKCLATTRRWVANNRERYLATKKKYQQMFGWLWRLIARSHVTLLSDRYVRERLSCRMRRSRKGNKLPSEWPPLEVAAARQKILDRRERRNDPNKIQNRRRICTLFQNHGSTLENLGLTPDDIRSRLKDGMTWEEIRSGIKDARKNPTQRFQDVEFLYNGISIQAPVAGGSTLADILPDEREEESDKPEFRENYTREQKAHVATLLNKLTETEREIIMLRLSGKNEPEVARRLGCSKQNVSASEKKALKKLGLKKLKRHGLFVTALPARQYPRQTGRGLNTEY